MRRDDKSPKDEVEEAIREIQRKIARGKIRVHVNPLLPGTIDAAERLSQLKSAVVAPEQLATLFI